MKNSIIMSFFLVLAFMTVTSNISIAQTTAKSFEIKYLDPSTSKYFRGNAHVVINHEEQYSFIDFKKAAEKNKSLTIITKDFPKNAFKAGSTLEVIKFSKNGKSLELQGIKVKKNQQKGKERKIELSYKGMK